jgi:hypothetical protein
VYIRKLSKLTNLKRIAKQSSLKLFKMAVIISQDLLNPMVFDLMSTFNEHVFTSVTRIKKKILGSKEYIRNLFLALSEMSKTGMADVSKHIQGVSKWLGINFRVNSLRKMWLKT